jgi:uncharacterized NAD-dependent epimerase/dehydratase family protein
MIAADARLALLMHGQLAGGHGKMGLGLLRYSRQHIVAVIDRDHAGADAAVVTGIPRPMPVVATSADARALGADTLVIGVAPPGGVLSHDYRQEILKGLANGMSLVNGLHGRFADDPEFAARLQPGRRIDDIRQEPPGLTNGTGAAARLACRRVLTVGTDMAIGKMTASLELDAVARARGLRSAFVATGQIGICIDGDGVALDAVRVDFASGAVEAPVLRRGADADIVWIEGQGSILHPASTAWLPLIRGSCPTHLILCHRAGQHTLSRDASVPIPRLRAVATLYEAVAAAAGALPLSPRVVGIALNCRHLSDDDARTAIGRTADETGLIVTDPVRFGADPLLDAVLAGPDAG